MKEASDKVAEVNEIRTKIKWPYSFNDAGLYFQVLIQE